MKLSEAIRRGAKLRPLQTTGTYYQGDQASCALGAAAHGAGLIDPDHQHGDIERRLTQAFPVLNEYGEQAPAYLLEAMRRLQPREHADVESLTLYTVILHANDDGTSREQIAAVLAEAGL